MGKASCTYISAFILFLVAIISFIVACLFSFIGLNFSCEGDGDQTEDKQKAFALSNDGDQDPDVPTQVTEEEDSAWTKFLSIPNQNSFTAGCIYLVSCFVLIAIGFVLLNHFTVSIQSCFFFNVSEAK